MPESHDTDFTWNEFVDRINNELIATYGNFANRVLSLSSRLPDTPGGEKLPSFNDLNNTKIYAVTLVEIACTSMTNSLEKHRYKEALNRNDGSTARKPTPPIFYAMEASQNRNRC